ncbi:hypothetical protein D3C72_1105490 [compost metagenome]
MPRASVRPPGSKEYHHGSTSERQQHPQAPVEAGAQSEIRPGIDPGPGHGRRAGGRLVAAPGVAGFAGRRAPGPVQARAAAAYFLERRRAAGRIRRRAPRIPAPQGNPAAHAPGLAGHRGCTFLRAWRRRLLWLDARDPGQHRHGPPCAGRQHHHHASGARFFPVARKDRAAQADGDAARLQAGTALRQGQAAGTVYEPDLPGRAFLRFFRRLEHLF